MLSEHEQKISDFKEAVQVKFPIHDQNSHQFPLFPFCNETGFYRVTRVLKSLRLQPSDKIPVALLIGESNFLSLLPQLAELAEVVVTFYFHSVKKDKEPQVCFVPMRAGNVFDRIRFLEENEIRQVIAGRIAIASISRYLQAHDTLREAKHFAVTELFNKKTEKS